MSARSHSAEHKFEMILLAFWYRWLPSVTGYMSIYLFYPDDDKTDLVMRCSNTEFDISVESFACPRHKHKTSKNKIIYLGYSYALNIKKSTV